ncbi:MAG TPA: hypothetical protein VIL77_01055 [Gaiellaceae bacterium]
MSSIEQCIEQLEAVRKSAVDPRAAYVIRSRLERLLLSCARLTAEMNASPEPDMPHRLVELAAQPESARKLAAACDAVHELTGSICRPSESLDVRWDEGWSRISSALDELDSVLQSQAQHA